MPQTLVEILTPSVFVALEKYVDTLENINKLINSNKTYFSNNVIDKLAQTSYAETPWYDIPETLKKDY